MNRMREMRAKKRLRQFDLSIKTGIPQSRLSFIENELISPSEEEKKKISEALGAKVTDVFLEM